jgi:hypothetical protein
MNGDAPAQEGSVTSKGAVAAAEAAAKKTAAKEKDKNRLRSFQSVLSTTLLWLRKQSKSFERPRLQIHCSSDHPGHAHQPIVSQRASSTLHQQRS